MSCFAIKSLDMALCTSIIVQTVTVLIMRYKPMGKRLIGEPK